MGRGCSSVTRSQTDGTEMVVGKWNDGRIGTFRGTRTGKHEYGGMVFGEKGVMSLGPYQGYDNLLDRIIEFFKTGTIPVAAEETIEIYTFMEAADESKRNNGKPILLSDVYIKHKALADNILTSLNI
jgi:hypothetical protein